MRNIDVPRPALISILVGIVSLWAFFANVFEIVSYYRPLDLEFLSEHNIEAGRYVKGTISECVTVPLFNRQDILSGTDGEVIGALGRTYNSYTIPISDGQFIRVWLYDMESIDGMERIVYGDTLDLSFMGKIQKGEAVNTAWYNWNPDFDQSKLVTDYVIWQKTVDMEENLCFVGIFGIVIAVLIYYFSGGIRIVEVQPEPVNYTKFRYNYNKENELLIARKHLEKYEEWEKEYRVKKNVGMVCGIVGFLIVLRTKLKWIGLILVIYGIKKCWNFFINSKNRYAVKVAKLFSIKTLQTKREEEELKIEVLENESLTKL